jgi:hypothetical protein
MMKNNIAGRKEAVKLSGDELNRRLEEQSLAIERISILLEDARLDPNDVMSLDMDSMHKLLELMSAYEAFVKHFRSTTEETVETLKGLTTSPGYRSCECDDDRDIDLDTADFAGNDEEDEI